MSGVPLDAGLVARLHAQAQAARWRVSVDAFGAALEASSAHAFAARVPSAGQLTAYLESLRLEDLALACACAAGDGPAWEHFMREHRPALHRAADAIDPAGGTRDLADALYADLYGLRGAGEARRSLFRYFHGRSSLATWLRAVLSQRHVDRLRTARRVEALPDEDSPAALASPAAPPDPDRDRLLACLGAALRWAVAALAPRDRLRLGCYYAQELTLARIGRLLGEHEATVSRHLARTRRDIREAVEARLRDPHGLDDAGVAQCFAAAVDAPGSFDLGAMIRAGAPRKNDAPDRSTA
jgi:RNA polymerase sigma-70 factor (ECF subfamily)